MTIESKIESKVDKVLTHFRTTTIQYYPYLGVTAADLYKQRIPEYGTAVSVVGRAVHNPTPEMISAIGDGEKYDIAFLFSRLEMKRRFPSAAEGDWIAPYGKLTWRGRTYTVEKVKPSGQVGEKFLLVIVLADSVEGHRDS